MPRVTAGEAVAWKHEHSTRTTHVCAGVACALCADTAAKAQGVRIMARLAPASGWQAEQGACTCAQVKGRGWEGGAQEADCLQRMGSVLAWAAAGDYDALPAWQW